jgi:hypothetical protein
MEIIMSGIFIVIIIVLKQKTTRDSFLGAIGLIAMLNSIPAFDMQLLKTTPSGKVCPAKVGQDMRLGWGCVPVLALALADIPAGKGRVNPSIHIVVVPVLVLVPVLLPALVPPAHLR